RAPSLSDTLFCPFRKRSFLWYGHEPAVWAGRPERTLHSISRHILSQCVVLIFRELGLNSSCTDSDAISAKPNFSDMGTSVSDIVVVNLVLCRYHLSRKMISAYSARI